MKFKNGDTYVAKFKHWQMHGSRGDYATRGDSSTTPHTGVASTGWRGRIATWEISNVVSSWDVASVR